MARIRTTKPEFWTSEQVADCDPLARLLFLGMWNFADDHGIHPASPKRLKMEVLPSDAIETAHVAAMVEQLVSARLLEEYEVDGARYWRITGWDKHQRIEKPSYKYPQPIGERSTNGSGKVADASATEWNGEEGKGKEGKSVSPSGLASSDADLLGDKPEKLTKEERLAEVTKDAVETFNASPLVKANGGLLSSVSTRVGWDTRRTQVRRCVKTARDICIERLDSQKVTREFWEQYWAALHADDFMSGRGKGGRGHENWKPDFEYFTRKATMLKVYEKAAEE